MRLSLMLTVIAVAGLLVTPARAQKATEMFVPIGQSPGVSGVTSVIGTIVSCDETSGVVTVSDDKGQHTATLTAETKIWLDRNMTKKSAGVGARSDCQQGRRVEVKYVYEGATRTARAEWIKIQVE